ncbi:MAG: putative protein serine/threonine kinase [Streblomastix strix]|uniref:non-specific serine/threonine protein kinase n=1 Tax=Streblomastix strix TaxID=222440 RepID=A0A5J4WQC4_9EUKA|nr:MAG: putative protein serine/threonine kinase [Streblomastix strix]
MSSIGQKPAVKHNWGDYKLIRALSSGAFGRLLHMTQIDNNKEVVIKRIQYVSDEEKKVADDEVKMLIKAQSKHIVKYLESFTYDLDLCIVMEFCSGGNLRVLIQAMKKMSIKDRKMKCYMPFYQMLSSLAHLHSLGIVHRDLKPENVFLDENGNTKTADFGLAQTMISKSYLKSAGTAVYAPSEAHMQNKMVFVSDIWVLAVIIIEMLTGVHPYAGRTVNDTIENIKKGKMVFPLPDYIQGELKEMLMKMLNVDADKRPSAKELLDTELMQFQAQIDKVNQIKESKSENEQINKKNQELETQVRLLKSEKEKEKRKSDHLEKEKSKLIENQKLNQIDLDQVLSSISAKISSQYDEVISQSEWIQMKNELEKQERGTVAQIEQIKKMKIEICQKIIAYLIGKRDDENRKIAIGTGIVDVLLHFFNTKPLESIEPTHAWAFFVFTYPTSNEIRILLTEKKPYPSLFRLLDHTNFIVLRRAITSIYNILNAEFNTSPDSQPHPHFQTIVSYGGIDKLYSLFKKNEYEKITDFCALNIGQLFKAKEITNIEMRKDVIAYFKAAFTGCDETKKEDAKWILGVLAENSVNRAEIEKDGFKIPE